MGNLAIAFNTAVYYYLGMEDVMTDSVPRISRVGNEAKSASLTPVNIADTCACWTPAEIKNARKMLTRKQDVVCLDATAYAALTAVALDMLYHGKTVRAKIVQGWTK